MSGRKPSQQELLTQRIDALKSPHSQEAATSPQHPIDSSPLPDRGMSSPPAAQTSSLADRSQPPTEHPVKQTRAYGGALPKKVYNPAGILVAGGLACILCAVFCCGKLIFRQVNGAPNGSHQDLLDASSGNAPSALRGKPGRMPSVSSSAPRFGAAKEKLRPVTAISTGSGDYMAQGQRWEAIASQETGLARHKALLNAREAFSEVCLQNLNDRVALNHIVLLSQQLGDTEMVQKAKMAQRMLKKSK